MSRRFYDSQEFYNYVLLIVNSFVGVSVCAGGLLELRRSCSNPLQAYMIISGLLWIITAFQDLNARRSGWSKNVECPTPQQHLVAKCMAGIGFCWLFLGNIWVLFTRSCANSLFWTARYYCILINLSGITAIVLLCFDSTAPYAESVVGVNYATVWRKKFAREEGYSDVDVVDAEYAAGYG